jgi:hypothetical protein
MTHLSSLQVEFRPLRSRRARYGAGVLVMAALLVTPSAAGRTLPSPQHRLTAERPPPTSSPRSTAPSWPRRARCGGAITRCIWRTS